VINTLQQFTDSEPKVLQEEKICKLWVKCEQYGANPFLNYLGEKRYKG